MLGKFIKINNTQMPNPNPGTFTFKVNADENVFTSESGYLLSNVKRLNRTTWTGTFNCSSAMKTQLLTYCQEPSVTCKINNVPYSGRLRLSGDCTLIANSENESGTDGLWEIPIIFEEF